MEYSDEKVSDSNLWRFIMNRMVEIVNKHIIIDKILISKHTGVNFIIRI